MLRSCETHWSRSDNLSWPSRDFSVPSIISFFGFSFNLSKRLVANWICDCLWSFNFRSLNNWLLDFNFWGLNFWGLNCHLWLLQFRCCHLLFSNFWLDVKLLWCFNQLRSVAMNSSFSLLGQIHFILPHKLQIFIGFRLLHVILRRGCLHRRILDR